MLSFHYPNSKHQAPLPILIILLIRPAAIPTKVGSGITTTASERNWYRLPIDERILFYRQTVTELCDFVSLCLI